MHDNDLYSRLADMVRRLLTATILGLVLWTSTGYGADYLDDSLRAEVNALIASVQASPTNAENVRERADVLWRWTNKWALAGRFVPVNLTTAVTGVLGFDGSTRPAQHRGIDGYVHQLAFVDEDPQRLGSLKAEGGPFIAAAFGTLTQTFTVGSADVETGGGFLVGRHFMAGYQFQTDDPNANNYISIDSSNTNVTFTVDSTPLRGMHGGFRGATGALVFRVSEGTLTQGDQVRIVYGDASQGGQGLRMPDIGTDFMVFPLYVTFDASDLFIALPIQPVSIVGSSIAGVHGFAPSVVMTGQPFEISVRARDRYYNRPSDPSPAWFVKLNGETVATTPPSDSAITRVELEKGVPNAGVYQLTIESADGAFSGYGNAILAEDEPQRYIYWGDTHGHSGFAEGLGTPDRFMRWAKEDAALDYVTHSEHDIWMDDFEWQVLIENVTKYSDSDFIAFLGYEWTRSKFLGGHHNVLFRTAEGRERVPAQLFGTLSQLYRGLHRFHDPNDVVVIPHAHQPGNYRLVDPDLEPLVEIMSQHGTFEWFGQKYLEHGHEVGFTAASDNHLSQPGYTAPKAGGLSQRGGLGALVASEKTRDSLFDAMKNINAYATTGDRVILDFTVNDVSIGKRAPFSAERKINGRVIAAWPIAEIFVLKNGDSIWHRDYASAHDTKAAREGTFKLSFGSDSHPYHEHDNPRGWKHWAGTVRVDGATLIDAKAVDFTNTQSQNLSVTSDDEITFSTLTRGDESSFDLTLTDISSDATLTIALNAGREYGGGPPTFRQHQAFEAQTFTMSLQGENGQSTHQHVPMTDYVDHIRIRRIITDGARDVSFELTDNGTRQGDYYYVRAVLTNDAIAWASPVWVGGYKTL